MAELAVQHLLKEHRGIEKILAKLETLLDLQKAESAWTSESSESLDSIARFVGTEVDRHCRKEEVLFAALEGYLPRDVGPLAVLRGEHADIFLNFSRMREAGRSAGGPNPQPRILEEFQSYGRATIRIVRDHIYKEDRVLFSLVARLLPADVDAQLLERMEAADGAEGVRVTPEQVA